MQNHLCEYGCGQEAKFVTKTGKWTCARNVFGCPETIRKIKSKYHQENCPKCGKYLNGNKGTILSHVSNCDGNGSKLDKIKRHKSEINHVCPKCNHYIKIAIQKHINWCDGGGPRRNRRKLFAGKRGGWNKGLTKETNESLKQTSETFKQRIKSGEIVSPWIGRKHTNETKRKLSERQIKYLQEHPEQVPYLKYHSSRESYPEKYFRELFEKENIQLKQYLRVGLFELDFYNEEKMIDVEIDGNTHLQEKVKEIDMRKDKYLSELGWTIIRIPWGEWVKKSYEQKHEEVEKIRLLTRRDK